MPRAALARGSPTIDPFMTRVVNLVVGPRITEYTWACCGVPVRWARFTYIDARFARAVYQALLFPLRLFRTPRCQLVVDSSLQPRYDTIALQRVTAFCCIAYEPYLHFDCPLQYLLAMVNMEALDRDSSSFELPAYIYPWLRAVVALGFISFIASVSLLFLLTHKLVSWQVKSKRTNQFVILIFNLLWADIQQSLAFLLNVEWLRIGSVEIQNPICFAQGWLVSTGDLGSGVWCFAIGLHTFASIILDFRLRPRYFYLTVFFLWVFILGVSSIGIGLHPNNLYVRSGVWCWIRHDLEDLRLWTHYVWIFILYVQAKSFVRPNTNFTLSEFGNVIIYALIYSILIHRIRTGYYTIEESKRVRSIANLMVVYPLIYVVCTIPLASARMASMSGHPPSLARLCLSGAMITSNGWLDVLLYTCTRRIMIFSDEPPSENIGIDTFSTFWFEKSRRFGGECTVEALNSHHTRRRARSKVTLPSGSDSSDDLCCSNDKDIKLVTTTQVTSEPAQPEDFEEMDADARRMRASSPTGRWSEDTSGSRSLSLKELALPHIAH